MAKTPGSPPETTATARPSAASVERKAGAVEFGAIVAGVGALVWPQGQAVEIRAIADDVARRLDRRARLRRHPFGGTGAEPDDHDPPAHGRRPRPGARMSEK